MKNLAHYPTEADLLAALRSRQSQAARAKLADRTTRTRQPRRADTTQIMPVCFHHFL